MGTKINEVMTERPRAVTPQTSVREAARLMEEEDVGSLPVVEGGVRLVGIVWNMTEKPGIWSSIAAVVGGYAVGMALALPFTRSQEAELAPSPEPAA